VRALHAVGPTHQPGVKSRAAALARLCAYGWPGNVRELENVIEQALVFAEGEVIDVGALPAIVRGGLPDNALALPPSEMSLPEILEDLERQLIQRAYDKSGGVKTETARLLGIKTSALYYVGEVRHRRHRELERKGGGRGGRAEGNARRRSAGRGSGTGRDRAR
jgi:DNA-binding NtrC family response regulator